MEEEVRRQYLRRATFRNIRFNQSLDENSYISAKIEAVKHLHAVFRLLAEQRRFIRFFVALSP